MKVTLLSYTPEALELLLFTKQTRLSMAAGLMEEIRAWPEEKKQAELEYMLGTIESSWEFVNYAFSIEDVSRAFTHQFVRTRSASFAQQSQRTVDMAGFSYVTPDAFSDVTHDWLAQEYHSTMAAIDTGYKILIDGGANPQDARGVLPTNIATNIIMGANLRTLSHTAEVRLCSRTQGEYQNVFRAMREQVLEVHPWADPFLRVACAKRGVCQFPNYEVCPIKPGIFNPDTGGVWPGVQDFAGKISVYSDKTVDNGIRPLTKNEIQLRWNKMKFEAVPRQSK